MDVSIDKSNMMLLLRYAISLRDQVDVLRNKMKDYDNEEQKQVEKIELEEIEQRNKKIQAVKRRIRIQPIFSLSIGNKETDDVISQIEEQLLNNAIDNSQYTEEEYEPINELNEIDSNNGYETGLKKVEFYSSREIQFEPIIEKSKQPYLDPEGLIMLILIYFITIVIIFMKIFI